MQTIEGTNIDLYVLDIDEDLPEEWNETRSTKYFMQGETLFKYVNTELAGYVTEVGGETTKKLMKEQKWFEKSTYRPGFIYTIREPWAEFPLPSNILLYSMGYFREIYAKHSTESALLLLLNPRDKTWKILIPLQGNSSQASVHYIAPGPLNLANPLHKAANENAEARKIVAEVNEEYSDLLEQGYRLFGTIHSHSNFGAFHSGVDDADEANFDGLHITVGNVNAGFSFSARYILGGEKFPKETQDLVERPLAELIKAAQDGIALDQNHVSRMMPDLGRWTPSKVTSQSHFPFAGYGKAKNLLKGNSDAWEDGENYRVPRTEYGSIIKKDGEVIRADQVGSMASWDELSTDDLNRFQGQGWITDDEARALKEAKEGKTQEELHEFMLHVHDIEDCILLWDTGKKSIITVNWTYYYNNHGLFNDCIQLEWHQLNSLIMDAQFVENQVSQSKK